MYKKAFKFERFEIWLEKEYPDDILTSVLKSKKCNYIPAIIGLTSHISRYQISSLPLSIFPPPLSKKKKYMTLISTISGISYKRDS
jgi:hypothetical protein